MRHCGYSKKYRKSKSFFLLFAMLLLLPPPPAVLAEEAESHELVEAVKDLVLEIQDNTFLFGSDNYSRSKSDFAATIERKDVQRFFEATVETSKNSAKVISELTVLTKAVDGLAQDMKGLAAEMSVVRQSDSAQAAEIARNKDELKDIRYFLGWLIVTLCTAIPSAHVYVHRNDNAGRGKEQ